MLLESIELRLEIQGLRELGLSEEEIEGFIDMFYDTLIVIEQDIVLN